jgi:acyl-coenzyme A synthetase/AMP-(fatty) acid ligase
MRANRPHHTAVVVPGEREVRLDWRDFNAYVNRWANALAGMGVARGHRVATILGNGLELLATYWACAKLGAARGAVVAAADGRPACARCSRDAAPRVVVASAMHRRAIDDVRQALDPSTQWVMVDEEASPDYRAFGALLAASSDAEPLAHVDSGDLLTLMYTSGRPDFRKAFSTRTSSGPCMRPRWPMRGGWRPSRSCCIPAPLSSTGRW